VVPSYGLDRGSLGRGGVRGKVGTALANPMHMPDHPDAEWTSLNFSAALSCDDGTNEMFTGFWTWFATLPPNGGSFLGSLTGSGLGLIALLLGALFNAHLNRRRDDRLRKEDARAAVSALAAELAGIKQTLIRNADSLDKPDGDFVVPDIAHSVRIMPTLLPKFGLLDVELAREVIDVYVSLDQYCEALMLAGGHIGANNRADRRLIGMPVTRASFVAEVNRDLVRMITNVLDRLHIYLSK
jgi:hypothetical protein